MQAVSDNLPGIVDGEALPSDVAREVPTRTARIQKRLQGIDLSVQPDHGCRTGRAARAAAIAAETDHFSKIINAERIAVHCSRESGQRDRRMCGVRTPNDWSGAINAQPTEPARNAQIVDRFRYGGLIARS